jgi:hypothetical protein
MNQVKLSFVFLLLVFCISNCKEEDLDAPPIVAFISPKSGTILDANFKVEVSAVANSGIRKVELYLNNLLIGSSSNEPFEFTIGIIGYDPGDYQLKAIAYSNTNIETDAKVTIYIAKASLQKPLEFRASKGEFGQKITMSWNTVPGASSYEVYKMDDSTKEFDKIGITNGTAYTDENVKTPLKQYFYKVRAYNSAKEYGEFSGYDYGYSNGNPYDLVISFGREGIALNELGFVVNLSYHDQVIYLVDDNNNRIAQYSKSGAYLGMFESYAYYALAPIFYDDKILKAANRIVTIQDKNNNLVTFNTGIIGLRQIAIDSEGFIYATSSYSHEVSKFDSNGNLVLKWGVRGDLPGQFNAPWGIAYFNDKIVVSNYYSKKVQFFSKAGVFIKEWIFDNTTHALFVKGDFIYIACGSYVAKTNYDGLIVEKIRGLFDLASSVAVDEENNIIVTDPYQRKIYVYRKN